ncbi:MAG: YkgJ family cysteine cluster protein [Candidatus Omnitrophota bacterium]
MSPCKKCKAECCKYFALQIDTPTAKGDFEDIRWYLAHKHSSVFIEKRKWYLEIAGECRYMTKDHKCRIYDKRPRVCRDHSLETCEGRGSGGFEHEITFNNMEEFDRYLKKRFKKKKKR